MDVQLKELIDKIKNDGVKSAEDSASVIIAEAELKAKSIVLDAEKKAADLKESSIKNAELATQSGIDAIKQSARDLVIDLNKEVENIFDSLIKTGTSDSLKGDGLSKAILAVLGNWDKESVTNLSVLLPESAKSDVLADLQASFKDLVKAGLEIKVHKNIEAGFKISEKDGNVYYDFSAEGVGQMMAEYLSPQLAQVVKEVKES